MSNDVGGYVTVNVQQDVKQRFKMFICICVCIYVNVESVCVHGGTFINTFFYTNLRNTNLLNICIFICFFIYRT